MAKAAKTGQQVLLKSSRTSSRKTTLAPVLLQSASKPESRLTTLEKMSVSREGVSKKDFQQLKEKTTLDYDQLAKILDVARTTLIAKKGDQRFSSDLSEKIMSLADIYSYGYEIFGDQQEFNQWVFQPLPALGGKAPYDFLDNHYGREEVRNIIGRIAYGVYS
jgi:putative toxin-antitoxin system antitoxin component (TIGR02293 family)